VWLSRQAVVEGWTAEEARERDRQVAGGPRGGERPRSGGDRPRGGGERPRSAGSERGRSSDRSGGRPERR